MLPADLGPVVLHRVAEFSFEGRDYRPTDAGPGLVIAASPELAGLVIQTWQQP